MNRYELIDAEMTVDVSDVLETIRLNWVSKKLGVGQTMLYRVIGGNGTWRCEDDDVDQAFVKAVMAFILERSVFRSPSNITNVT